jgi:hypothetical protein
MLKEVLPLDKGISSSDIRDRILDLGKQLDAEIECDIAQLPLPERMVCSSAFSATDRR